MAISLEDLILEFLTELHGTAMRKGILKFKYEHPRDVVRYSFLETLDNPVRVARLRKLGLLHDVVEEGCDPQMITSLFSLDEQESHLLALLSRNVPDVAGREYWTRIIDSEDALIVKLADRLANLLDLIAWVDRGGGFTDKAALQAEKYFREYEQFVPLFTSEILQLAEGDSHPFAFQIPAVHSIMEALHALYLIHSHAFESFPERSRGVLDPFDEFRDILKYKWRYKEPLSTRYRTELIDCE